MKLCKDCEYFADLNAGWKPGSYLPPMRDPYRCYGLGTISPVTGRAVSDDPFKMRLETGGCGPDAKLFTARRHLQAPRPPASSRIERIKHAWNALIGRKPEKSVVGR